MVNYSIIVTGKTTIEDNFLENRLDVCYYPRYIGFTSHYFLSGGISIMNKQKIGYSS
jgi:hypothetical protein